MSRLFPVTRLALMPYSQDADDIEYRIAAIEREISSCSPRDHEFANVIIYSPPNERMGLENTDCASNVPKRWRSSLRGSLQRTTVEFCLQWR